MDPGACESSSGPSERPNVAEHVRALGYLSAEAQLFGTLGLRCVNLRIKGCNRVTMGLLRGYSILPGDPK